MDWFATQCDQLRAMFGGFFASRVTDGIMALARPALRLSARHRAERSRLGGPPVLPAGASWPTWGARRLDFLGVIDFGELASVLWLPELPGTGAAAFYYVTEMPRPWGDDPGETDGWRVLPDADVPAGEATRPEVRLGAAPFVSLPSPHEPALWPIAADANGFAEVYPQLYESWASFAWGGEPRHQAGGWPMVVQRTLWRDCALAAAGLPLDSGDLATSAQTGPPVLGASNGTNAEGTGDRVGNVVHDPANTGSGEHDWRLLLQLDSDERLGWYWGETGFVYFSARAADVRAGALDRSWLILQATP
jgi:hypothetical protein